MKLKINQACDLSSISVLPPPSRRSSGFGLGSDPAGLGKTQASQLRSQSQQSFSQGMSLSQLSQSSFEENPANDQRFGSQERDNSSKRITSLAPMTSTREESQMQLSRTSNNVLRRWNSASVSDNKCLVGEELEHRLRLMEGSLNRLTMILDSVQSDVMQANRAVKEWSLEMEGIRQKLNLIENSVQQMVRVQEDTKASLEARLRSVSIQMEKESDSNKLKEILSSVMALPEQIQVHLLKLQHEVCGVFTKQTELIAREMSSFGNSHLHAIHSAGRQSYLATQQSQKVKIPRVDISTATSPKSHSRRANGPKIEAEYVKPPNPNLTCSKPNITFKLEEIPWRPQEPVFRINIDSDDESNEGASCLILKTEKGSDPYMMDEAREETRRILRRARKRRRRQNSIIIV